MSETTDQPKPALSRAEVMKITDSLKEKYPVLKKGKPLCYEIKEEIQADNPDLTREEIIAVIKRHVKSPKYLRKMLSKTHRYNLKDEAVSEISEVDKAYAVFKNKNLMLRNTPRPQAVDTQEK
jgi:hypothetical protein